VRPNVTGVRALDVLLHHYYGGLVACALRRFDAAFDLFHAALIVPARALSAVQIEAYKKVRKSLQCFICLWNSA
jgi:hypothetical protein